LTGPKPVPFRTWYGNLGQLRTLFKEVNLIVCTATATKATKRKVFDVLEIKEKDVFCVEKSPECPNLTYHVQYVDNNLEFDKVFHSAISELGNMQKKTKRGPNLCAYMATCKDCKSRLQSSYCTQMCIWNSAITKFAK
jgi:superfamily II DNA helicase RecQ